MSDRSVETRPDNSHGVSRRAVLKGAAGALGLGAARILSPLEVLAGPSGGHFDPDLDPEHGRTISFPGSPTRGGEQNFSRLILPTRLSAEFQELHPALESIPTPKLVKPKEELRDPDKRTITIDEFSYNPDLSLYQGIEYDGIPLEHPELAARFLMLQLYSYLDANRDEIVGMEQLGKLGEISIDQLNATPVAQRAFTLPSQTDIGTLVEKMKDPEFTVPFWGYKRGTIDADDFELYYLKPGDETEFEILSGSSPANQKPFVELAGSGGQIGYGYTPWVRHEEENGVRKQITRIGLYNWDEPFTGHSSLTQAEFIDFAYSFKFYQFLERTIMCGWRPDFINLFGSPSYSRPYRDDLANQGNSTRMFLPRLAEQAAGPFAPERMIFYGRSIFLIGSNDIPRRPPQEVAKAA